MLSLLLLNKIKFYLNPRWFRFTFHLDQKGFVIMYHKLSDPSKLRKIYPKIKEPMIELQDLQKRKMLFIEYNGLKIINVRFFDKVHEIEQWIDRDTISKYLRKNESSYVYWGSCPQKRTDDPFWNNIIDHFIFYPDYPNRLKSDVILLESYIEDVWYKCSPHEGYNFMISSGFIDYFGSNLSILPTE